VIILVDDATGDAVLVRLEHRACGYIERSLLVVRFVGMGKEIPAESQVQREAAVEAPVVLREEAVFLADVGEVAGL